MAAMPFTTADEAPTTAAYDATAVAAATTTTTAVVLAVEFNSTRV